MATEFPIIRLQKASTGARIKSKVKPRFPRKIPYDQQARRLGRLFENAETSLAGFNSGVDVATDPRAVVPERCLVFELIGAVQGFNVAAQALGLEWLLAEDAQAKALDDEELDDEDTSDGEGADADRPEPKLLYLTMPTESALRRLLSQWKLYSKGGAAPPSYKELWKLFDYLSGMRVWSFEDRLDPGMARYVESILSADGSREVLVEIDLWYRTEKERRDRSIATLEEMLEEVGGELLDLVDIAEIRYQGALIRISAQVARRLIAGEDGLALLDEVMTIRPQSAYASRIDSEHASAPRTPGPLTQLRPALAAVLDGYPVSQHDAIRDRLRIIEVDVTGAQVPVSARHHGTAMASLVLHGDLQDPAALPLGHRLLSIPVLAASSDGLREVTPEQKLPIGLIYRALKTIVDARSGGDAELANVVIVNHSICDDFAPFVRRPSPWATLLDYFSHEHRLLFVVSAGNVFTSYPLPDYANAAAFRADTPQNREAYMLAIAEQAKGNRGILSPAESVNALTVGAIHADAATPGPGLELDPYPTHPMANLASGLGLGVNRSVKPDLVEQGGRFVAHCANLQGGGVEMHPRPSVHYGQMVAAPSATGETARYIRTAGTSNAAAMITRAGHAFDEPLDQTFGADGMRWRDLRTRVPILKALLVHGCNWGPFGKLLDNTYPPQGQGKSPTRRTTISRFLGFGRPNLARVVSGEANRITLLAEDVMRAGQMHEYSLPIPSAMMSNREIRTVTVTLSWTCPTTHTTSDHRAVTLKLCDPNGGSKYWKGVTTDNRAQPTAAAAARGTVIHVVHSGRTLQRTAEGRLAICVQATSKTGHEGTIVPYALAITLELGQEQRSTLYAEIAQAVRVRPRVRQSV